MLNYLLQNAEILKNARIASGVDIEKIAHEIHIKSKYLIAIESADQDSLPRTSCIDWYIKCYAKYLKVDLLSDQKSTYPLNSLLPLSDNVENILKKYLTIFSIIALFCTGVVYKFYFYN